MVETSIDIVGNVKIVLMDKSNIKIMHLFVSAITRNILIHSKEFVLTALKELLLTSTIDACVR